jgi:hypothetical protein
LQTQELVALKKLKQLASILPILKNPVMLTAMSGNSNTPMFLRLTLSPYPGTEIPQYLGMETVSLRNVGVIELLAVDVGLRGFYSILLSQKLHNFFCALLRLTFSDTASIVAPYYIQNTDK